MLKLLLCLAAAFAVAGCLLMLRQQRLELGHDVNRLHRELQSAQVELWRQQVAVAARTGPEAIGRTVGDEVAANAPAAALP